MIHDTKVLLVLLLGVLSMLFGACAKGPSSPASPSPSPSPSASPSPPAPRPIPARLPMPTAPTPVPTPALAPTVKSPVVMEPTVDARPATAPTREPLWRQRARNY